MPDVVTADERALIEDAIQRIPADKRRVPPGSGHKGFVWCAKRKQLVLVEPEQKVAWNKKRGKALCPKVAARRVLVRDMMEMHIPAHEIARKLGVGMVTIYTDAKRIGRQFREYSNGAPSGPTRTQLATQARIDRLKELPVSEMTRDQIAAELGCSESTLDKYLRDLGLKAARKQRKRGSTYD